MSKSVGRALKSANRTINVSTKYAEYKPSSVGVAESALKTLGVFVDPVASFRTFNPASDTIEASKNPYNRMLEKITTKFGKSDATRPQLLKGINSLYHFIPPSSPFKSTIRNTAEKLYGIQIQPMHGFLGKSLK